MWNLGTNINTTQLTSSEMEGESHLLRMLCTLTLFAEKACATEAIVTLVGGSIVTPVATTAPEGDQNTNTVEEGWIVRAESDETRA